MKLIAVLGAAHCGSTAFNLVMDGLPGVAGVGESHWLVDPLGQATQLWDEEHRRWPCRTCGSDCPVLTTELASALQADPSDWWRKLADACGAETVVSTDKRPIHFDRFGLPDLAIVLWRQPCNWVASWRRRHVDHSIDRSVKIWNRIYTSVIKWCGDRRIRFVAVEWDQFRLPKDAAAALRGVCESANVEFDAGALDIGRRPHHHVGGYLDVVTDRILSADQRHTELTDAQRRYVNAKTRGVLCTLEALEPVQ